MAGPVASLLLPQLVTEAQIAGLDGWLRESGQISQVEQTPDADTRYSADFSFTDYPPLVTEPNKSNCTFLLNLVNPGTNEEFLLEDDGKDILQTKLGFVPKELIVVSAMCNQPLDHQLLAQVLIDLAGKFGADIIDMHGEIENRPNLSGKVIEVPSIENPSYIPIVVDVEFLKNWLNHPNFHMVK